MELEVLDLERNKISLVVAEKSFQKIAKKMKKMKLKEIDISN